MSGSEPLAFAAPDIAVEHRPDGAIVLRSRQPLAVHARVIGVWLEDWAAAAPERTFLAERDAAGGWRRVGYRAAWEAARSIGQALLDRGLGPGRPVAILSENSIDHALLTLGALHVGVPVVPISVAYSRLSQDFGKLRHIVELVRPGLIYARDGALFAKALAAIAATATELVVDTNPPPGQDATLFADLLR